jgi:maltose O-acetyltransferase
MINKMQSYLVKIIVYLKYKNIIFGSIGTGVQLKALTSNFTYAEKIHVGNNVHIGPRANFDGAGGIKIGDGCVFAPEVKIFTRTHNYDQDLQALPFDNVQLFASVHIGRYVWIGSSVIVLPGVSIGEGAVIGAGAVVSKNIPAFAVAAGNPARVIRYRDEQRFLKLVSDDKNFVYTKFGRKKIMRKKI